MRKKNTQKGKCAKKRKIGGFLSPAVLAGITAASHILQTGSYLYKNYKLAKNSKVKRGAGFAKHHHRRRRRKRKRNLARGQAYSLRLQKKKR